MIDWMNSNRDSILKEHPEAKPMLNFFIDYFNSCTGGYYFVDILKNAIRGQGANIQETSTYLLMNDILDDGYVIDAAEFYYYDELDGTVQFKTFALVLKLIALAYVDFYPDDKDEILRLLQKIKQVYAI